jgi:hypothetical protein
MTPSDRQASSPSLLASSIFSRPSTIALAIAAMCGLPNAGCDTIGQDVKDFTGGLFPPSPSEAATMMFDPYDPDQRREGIVWISNSPFGGGDVYLKAYRDFVAEDLDPGVRAAAIAALARYGEPADADLITPHLTDANRHVRWEAARGLQRLHHPPAVPPLLTVLRDPDETVDVRTEAALALGQYPEDRVFQELLDALDSPDLSVNSAASKSLATLTGQNFGLEPEPWFDWYQAQAAPFEHQVEYLYPTFSREETFLEKLVFWSKKTFEQPGPPAGLRPEGERSTYDIGEGG